jgi:hypothetical protein
MRFAFPNRNDDFTIAFAAFALWSSAKAMTHWALRRFLDGHKVRSIEEFVRGIISCRSGDFNRAAYMLIYPITKRRTEPTPS